jgi:hypothetical protein
MNPSTNPICHAGRNLSSEHTAMGSFDAPCSLLNNDTLDFFSTSDLALFGVVLSTFAFGFVWVSSSQSGSDSEQLYFKMSPTTQLIKRLFPLLCNCS